MDYSNFLMMKEELSLIAVMVILLLYDLMASKNGLWYFQPVACILFGVHTLLNIVPGVAGEAFGGMYQYTPMMGVVKSILNVGTLIVLMQAEGWLKSDTTVHKRGEFYFLTLTTLPLVMHAMDEKARYAGRKYLVYSLSGAAFAFIGIVFLLNYGVGHLNFTYGGILDQSLAAGNERTLELVFVAAFFGFGVKAAVFPFHGWLPDASVAPTPVSALLHAVAVVKAGAFAVLRLIYYGFGADFLRGSWAQTVVMTAAIVTIVYGSARALRTPHLKRRLAFSMPSVVMTKSVCSGTSSRRA